MRALLQSHKRRTGIGEVALLRGAADKPDGLTSDTIAKWMRGDSATGRKDHVEYVLRRWDESDCRFPLTHEIIESLRGHKERTGVGPALLLRGRKFLPLRLKPATIESWLSGAAESARASHLKTVLELWAALPDNPYVELTGEMAGELAAVIEATGVTPTRLLRMAEDPPADLKASDVSRWKTRRVATVRQGHFCFVMNSYRALLARQKRPL